MDYMMQAIALAQKAARADEVPIGAVIVKGGKVIARAYNKREHGHDATAHAEVLAIKKACRKIKDFRLIDCDMYVTLEPCAMCMGAILNARIANLYYGASANKPGVLTCAEINERAGLNHTTNIVAGVHEQQCRDLVQQYFAYKRKAGKK